jgi:virginiamycin A acetyltransferase
VDRDPPPHFKVLNFPTGSKAFIHETGKVNNVTIGRYSYINFNSTFGGGYPIRIGAFSSIGKNVYCWTYESHQTIYPSTFPLRDILGVNIGYSECVRKPEGVTIGNDVWIADDVRIMAGVNIGDGCVIGARAVVTRNCEPYGVYVGVPARQVKMRFPLPMIEQLQQIQWWNWPLEKIQRNFEFFSLDLTCFTGDLCEKIKD